MTDAFIACYLVAQVALPLGYYLGLRAPADERFAWRMFSAARLDRCEAAVTVRDTASGPPRPFPLDEPLQRGWVVQLTRGQPRVVEGVLARACEEAGAISATLVRRCEGEAPASMVTRACRPAP